MSFDWGALARPRTVPVGSPLYDRLMASHSWLAQEKVDGMRCLVRLGGPRMSFTSRHGRALDSLVHGSVRQELGGLLGTYEFDAELKDGYLWVFDILQDPDGHFLAGAPLSERIMRLSTIIPEDGPVRRVRSVREGKEEYYRHCIENGAEGIVLKAIYDPYPPGAGAVWFKVKP